MSYTERDAWLDEKALGDWPFSRWRVEPFTLREGFRYFGFAHRRSDVGALQWRLQAVIGRENQSESRLQFLLGEAVQVIETAIEHSETDAYCSWLKHDVWLPVLDDSLIGENSPAELLSQSLDYVGPTDHATEREMLSAVGLWLVGEYARLPASEDYRHAAMIGQIGVALAGASYLSGHEEALESEAKRVSRRNRAGAEARHAANRERLANAEDWWNEIANGVLSQAEAARQISRQFHVVEDVAKRWVRQFKRKADAGR